MNICYHVKIAPIVIKIGLSANLLIPNFMYFIYIFCISIENLSAKRITQNFKRDLFHVKSSNNREEEKDLIVNYNYISLFSARKIQYNPSLTVMTIY